jgi:hypothetical protein
MRHEKLSHISSTQKIKNKKNYNFDQKLKTIRNRLQNYKKIQKLK